MGKIGPLTLVFFGLLAFFNAIRHPFVHDDVVFILNNPHIADLEHWYEAFRVFAPSVDVNTYFRPVLEVIYRLEYHFFGPHPAGYHLVNIIIHIANGLLLFGLLQKLGLRRNLAWVMALLFLIHPVQSEAVACISGISNLVMSLGVLLALHAYLNRWYTMSLLFFALAFLSKEQGILFVPLVMVIDCYRKESVANKCRSWFFWVLAALLLLWMRQAVTGASLYKDIMVSPGEFYLRLAAVPRDIEMYLRLIFCPYDLHYYRSTDILRSNTFAWALGIVYVLGVYYVFKRWIKARPVLVLGLGWFLAALLPVLNIAPLINEYSFILTSEHFLYLPIVGILIIVVTAADYLLQSSPLFFTKRPASSEAGRHRICNSISSGLGGVVITVCLLLTWHQNTFWRSEMALFERMLDFEPNFGRGHFLLANAYYFNGRPGQADWHYAKAFAIMSIYAEKATNLKAEKYYQGIIEKILFNWAQNDSALGHWTMALQKYKRAALIDGKDASLYNNIAFVYVQLGDKKDAYLSLEQALRVDPAFAQARRNLQLLGPP